MIFKLDSGNLRVGSDFKAAEDYTENDQIWLGAIIKLQWE